MLVVGTVVEVEHFRMSSEMLEFRSGRKCAEIIVEYHDVDVDSVHPKCFKN